MKYPKMTNAQIRTLDREAFNAIMVSIANDHPTLTEQDIQTAKENIFLLNSEAAINSESNFFEAFAQSCLNIQNEKSA